VKGDVDGAPTTEKGDGKEWPVSLKGTLSSHHSWEMRSYDEPFPGPLCCLKKEVNTVLQPGKSFCEQSFTLTVNVTVSNTTQKFTLVDKVAVVT
jgi:hypothetical protein